ncbi:hypothetical protein LIER_19527 [Lithospermum erythrorhizon]|uniref:Uncharacterized protein n=1 Tax=Lithospermum erythrorhizon TaxID=34254 RepID=A0AAV3QI33_LITER
MDWKEPIFKYLTEGILPSDSIEASQPKEQRKLSHKWERPYWVRRVMGPRTYELEDLDGKVVPRTWHASKLCKYYV